MARLLLLLLRLRLARAWRAGGPGLDKRVTALAHELRCLVCQNQTLADSNAPLAVDLRNQIREQLAGGQERAARCIDFMVARYGDFVLYRPPLKASTLALWTRPVRAPRARRLAARAAGSAQARAASRSSPKPSASARRSCSNDAVLADRRRARGGRGARLVLRPLLSRGRHAAAPRASANLSIYRDQLRELDADLAAGTLARRRTTSARGASSRPGCSQDVGRPEREPRAACARAAARVAWALGAAVPLAALALYLLVGNPGGARPQSRAARLRRSSSRRWSSGSRRACARTPTTSRAGSSSGAPTACSGAFPRRPTPTPRRRCARRATRSSSPILPTCSRWRAASACRASPRSSSLRALELDPQNLKALALAGTAAFERKDFAARGGATGSACCRSSPPGSEDARAIQREHRGSAVARPEAGSRSRSQPRVQGNGVSCAEAQGEGGPRRHGVHLRARGRRARRCRSRCSACRCATCRRASRSTTRWRWRPAMKLSALSARGRRGARVEDRQRDRAARRPAGRERAGRERRRAASTVVIDSLVR